MFNARYSEVLGEPFKASGMGGNSPPLIIAGALGAPPYNRFIYLYCILPGSQGQ